MVGCLVVGLDSGSDIEFKAFLFKLVLGFEGCCVLAFWLRQKG